MENLAIVPKESLESIQAEIQEIKAIIQQDKQEELQKAWLTKLQAKKVLNVCMKTLDNYLSKGIIPYSRFGAKIYIRAADIQAHLEKHLITA